MNVEILYYSATGNTWWVAEKLSERLVDKGVDARLVSFETREREKLPSGDAELFGVAFPCYGTGPPPNVDRYLRELGEGEGSKCFVLTTYALYNGSTAVDAARMMRKKSFDPVLACGVVMPMNIWLPKLKVWPIPKPDKAEKIKRRAIPEIEKITDWLVSGTRVMQGKDPVNHLLSRGQYFIYRKLLMDYVNRSWSVDENCDLCELCEKICSAENIRVTEDGVRFLGRCILCIRCYSFCPKKAIQFAGKTQNYYRYPGVEKGYRPPGVEYI